MAAVMAKGTTTIYNALWCHQQLCKMLVRMGAKDSRYGFSLPTFIWGAWINWEAQNIAFFQTW
jgi:hypothetical protein